MDLFITAIVSFFNKIFSSVFELNSERMKELKAFDNTKLGVKGLVDAGIVNIPKMFVRPAEEVAASTTSIPDGIPVIDLDGIFTDDRRHKRVVDELRSASENWGFFQVVNHGIPVSVVENMMAGIRKFNGDVAAKKEYYCRDKLKQVNFNSNYDLFKTKTVNWRDTIYMYMLTPDDFDPKLLPVACRDEATEYVKHITELGNKLFDLLSEALSLSQDHLRSIHCNELRLFAGHYYPECPEPELAIGLTEHSDNSFLTVVAQDQTGGLQVLRDQHQWVDVQPIPGAFVVNIGDLLQLVSNDKFKSVVHRVLPSRETRLSTVFFFSGRFTGRYGPIKELISEENPPKYKEIVIWENLKKFYSKGLYETANLNQYRL